MAQRIGYKDGGALPRFHQLEWAGFVTSFTRMKLYAAIVEAADSLIAVETDAIFCTRPLTSLVVGSGLGEWEVNERDWITYLQNGTYWYPENGEVKAKYRGFDHGSISHSEALEWLEKGNWGLSLLGTTTRFIGSGMGLGSPLHRTWVTDSRDMRPGASGKRMHVSEICNKCHDGIFPSQELHPLACISQGGHSYPHSLPWRDDNAPGLEWQEMWEIGKWDAKE